MSPAPALTSTLPPQAPPVKVDPLTGKLVPANTPPTSPTLGFSLFAQDPQNQRKVMPSMTQPGQPLQPGAGNPPPMAAVTPPRIQPDVSAALPMASSMPPLTAGQSALIPPGGFKQQIAQTQTNVNAPPLSDVTAPLSMPPTQGAPVMASSRPPVQSQAGADMAEYQRVASEGAGLKKIQNPWLRGGTRALDIALDILAPGVAMAIPGTGPHNLVLQNQLANRVAQDQAAQQADLTQQQGLAGLAKTQAETAAIPINAGMKRQQYQMALASKGLREDENGNIVADEESPAYKSQQMKDELVQSQTDAQRAGIELKNAQTAFEKTKNDPNSPAYKLAMQRLAIAQQNAGAAQQRAQAYMGRYMQSAYNVGINGEVLPGAPQITDESGAQTVVGTGNAPQAVKAQASVAQFNDIDSATNNIETAAKDLVGKGGSLNSPSVAAAIADPSSTSGQWAQGQFATSGLSPQERNYVVQVKAYKENLQGLRKSAGGGVSDSQVDRLMSLAPGAGTPDLDYLMRQTGQIRAMRGRLATGVTTVKGGARVANSMAPPTSGGLKVGDPVTLKDGTKVIVKVVHPDGSFD
jgi:hypothetical protein